MNVSRWCIDNPIATIVFFVILTIGGLFAFKKVKVQLFPDLELPMIVVSAALPGAQPAQMETEVARKMENSIAGVQGLRHIYTTASDGFVTITAEFRLEKSAQEALDEVRQALGQIRADLPSDMEEPVVTKLNVAGAPIAAYSISSSRMDEQELSWFVDDALSRKLLAVNGVGSVARVGGVTRQVQIELNTERMQSLGLTASEVSQQLRALQLEIGAGRVKLGGVDQALRTVVGAQTAQELANLPISTRFGAQTLGQIATVTDTVAELESAAFLDGKPVVSIEISRSKNASDVEVGDGVEKALSEMKLAHPDLQIVRAFDFFTPVREDFHASMSLLLEGALLAVIVVWIFLRDWRATLVSATALPLSVLPAMLGLYLMGYTFNMPTLLALSLVIGILVDDAIVEVENIVRHMRMGKSPFQAAKEAADEIGLAVIATTFTIIAVFLPTAFMTGIPGMMFKQFSLTAVFAVFASLVVARMLTPMMAAYILKNVESKHDAHNGPLLKRYMRMVHWVVDHRLITIAAAIAFFVLSLALTPLLPKGFIPPDDNDQTQIYLELAPGSTLAETTQIAEETRQLVQKNISYIQSVYTAVGGGKAGGDSFAADTGGDPRKATLTILLKPRGDRPKKQVVEDQIRQLMLQIPGAKVKVGLGGSGEKYNVMLLGEDPTSLAAVGKAFEKDLRTVQGWGIELGLTRAVSAHGVDMHAGLQQMTRNDDGTGFVGGDGGHNICTCYGVLHAGADDGRGRKLQQKGLEIAQQFLRCSRVDVKQAQLAHAQQFHEGQGLKFALGTIADQGHAAAIRTAQMARRHGGCGCGTQGGGQRQFADNAGHAGGHIGQRAEGHHCGQAVAWVQRVAVDVFEGIVLRIGHGHQLNHAAGGMRRSACTFVKVLPAAKVGFDGFGDEAQYLGNAHAGDQTSRIAGAEKVGLELPCRLALRDRHIASSLAPFLRISAVNARGG